MKHRPQLIQPQHTSSAPHWRRRQRRALSTTSALPQVDGWRLTAKAGSGATANVFLAQPTEQSSQIESDYALKMLKEDLVDSESAARRLRREVLAAKSTSHRNLVPILAANFQHPPFYVLMPRLRGATLDRVIASADRIDVPRSLWIARQIADALGALHAAGWMHLDVKPENIATDTSGHCTLFDLDLSLPTPSAAGSALQSSAACLRGTLKYTAPELFTSVRSAVPASDVYSLGSVLYEMLTGRLPFACCSPEQLVEAHREQLAPSLRSYVPTIPVKISRLVTRLLAKDPSRRPTTDGELQDELARLEIECFSMRGIETDGRQLADA